ncbi:Peroxidase 27 [Vitis vinifera]|uniref:Peroxidase n=1 Tax=Vitis vinifera TaxID=29760 RepID=A0A438JWM6_VITVI|nr:Peroxidase 27 [Vitis vinifera]
MVASKGFSCLFLQLLLLSFVFDVANSQGLKVGFYRKTCPNAEAIVEKVVDQAMSVAPSLSGPLLRMHFHDCFVRLRTLLTKLKKMHFQNLSLRGYQVIDRVKSALEKACPGVVSCSDILALVARDVVVAMKGPSWKVETGRRDGRVSNITEALTNFIPPTANITQLKSGFQQKGLKCKRPSGVISYYLGGHTLGTSHCSSFSSRLYNFSGKGDTDPDLDPNYIAKLKNKCKQGDANSLVEMDPGSFKTFDESYYTLVGKRRGLFVSDAALLDDSETKAYVKLQATTHGSTFFEDFGVSMINMGRIGVLTGTSGEIRKECALVN